MKHLFYIGILGLCISLSACNNPQENNMLRTGAENTNAYLALLEGKRVGILTNHTALIEGTHLVDSLLSLGVDIRMIFAPEHGFRGDEDAGTRLDHQTDPKTGIPIISVYGSVFIPADSLMRQIDVAVYDIQDVGLRFYTYLSSMYYFMEACARNNVPLLVFDRPNPNGHIVSGPVLDMQFRSFVGIIPIPVVHGMTQTVTNTMHLLIPNSFALLVTETAGTAAQPIGTAVRQVDFVAEAEQSFETAWRYAQPVLNIYGDNYSRSILEISTFSMPGMLVIRMMTPRGASMMPGTPIPIAAMSSLASPARSTASSMALINRFMTTCGPC